MKFEVLRIEFCVQLTPEQWDALNQKADYNGMHGTYKADLYMSVGEDTHPEIKLLKKAGCYDLEWNGHFGMNFLFKCNEEDVVAAKKAVERFFKVIVKGKK